MHSIITAVVWNKNVVMEYVADSTTTLFSFGLVQKHPCPLWVGQRKEHQDDGQDDAMSSSCCTGSAEVSI